MLSYLASKVHALELMHFLGRRCDATQNNVCLFHTAASYAVLFCSSNIRYTTHAHAAVTWTATKLAIQIVGLYWWPVSPLSMYQVCGVCTNQIYFAVFTGMQLKQAWDRSGRLMQPSNQQRRANDGTWTLWTWPVTQTVTPRIMNDTVS